MAELLLDNVLEMYKKKNWKGILNLNPDPDDKEVQKILWVWPDEASLNFLQKALVRFKVRQIISIGCGCGLLEWIIGEFTKLHVIGVEVNQPWWSSKYSVPSFIPLNYIEDNIVQSDGGRWNALLFCYFNNGEAFRSYVRNFDGIVVIIIGPNDEAGRHTNPQPFAPDFGSTEWCLDQFQEIKNSKDFIAIYIRKSTSVS